MSEHPKNPYHLAWVPESPGFVPYVALTPFGEYTIRATPKGTFRWTFEGYWDSDEFPDTAAARAAAEADWRRRVDVLLGRT